MHLGQSAKRERVQERTNIAHDGVPIATFEPPEQRRNPSGFQPVSGRQPPNIGSDSTIFPNGLLPPARTKQQTLLGVVPNDSTAKRPPPPSSRQRTDRDIVTSAPSVSTVVAQPVKPPASSRQQTQLGIAPPPSNEDVSDDDLQTIELKPPPQTAPKRNPMQPRGILDLAEKPKQASSAPPPSIRDRMPSDAIGEQLTAAARKISVAPRSTTPPPARLPSPPPAPAIARLPEPPEAETTVFERSAPDGDDPEQNIATLHRPMPSVVRPPAAPVRTQPKPHLVQQFVAPPTPKQPSPPATNAFPIVSRSSSPPPMLQPSGRTIPPAGRKSQRTVPPSDADLLNTIATCDMSMPAKMFEELVRKISPEHEMRAALKFQELYSSTESEKERARYMRALGFIEGRQFQRTQKTPSTTTTATPTEQTKPAAPKKPTDWGYAAAIGLNLLAFPAVFFPLFNIMEKGLGNSIAVAVAVVLTLSLPLALRKGKRAYGNKWFYHLIAVGIATVTMSVFAYRAKSTSPQKPAVTATAEKAKKPTTAKPVASVNADSESDSEETDKEQ